jgi:hypothetical protein
VHAGPIYAHIIPGNLLFDLLDVSFLVIVAGIKVSSVSNHLLGESISLEMLSLMKLFFPSLNFMRMPVLAFAKKIFFSQTIFFLGV